MKWTLVLFCTVIAVSCETLQEYLHQRESLIYKDVSKRFDADIVLTSKEVKGTTIRSDRI
jgi:VanZ family protein